MAEYQTRCSLFVNGKEITDFKTVTEEEVDRYKQVPLMNKTGHAALMPRYKVSLEYVVPISNPVDWSKVADATCVIVDLFSGDTDTYTGVHVLKEGAKKRDSENEITQTVELGAEDKF